MSSAVLESPRSSRRTLRFDPPTPLQGALRTDPGEPSRAPVRSPFADVPERRREERFEAVSHRAWVGWRRWNKFRTTNALIVNISRGGALVFLDAPPARRTAWLVVDAPGQRTVLLAAVREVTMTRHGQCAARLTFRQTPPLGLFDFAVCGLPPVDPKRRADRRPLG